MPNPVPVIVVAQLFGTSLWFSANSAADDLIRAWGITAADIGTLDQRGAAGFILGTLTFALSGLADRYPASRIFACARCSARCATARSRCSPTAWPSECRFVSPWASAWPVCTRWA